MNIETAVATIKSNFQNLNDRDMTFAFDLVGTYDRRGSVSEKQAVWLVRLAERATGKQPEAASVGNMSGVYALFEAAKASGLKYPKIVAMSPVGEIKLSVAGPNAKAPGTINVVEAGAAFGEAKWYGRVHQDGTFEGRSAPAELVDYLKAFAANPAEQAALHGKRTGNCCFCGHTLVEQGSVEVGFGPICASRFGLAHPQNDKSTSARRAAIRSEIATRGKRSVWAA